MKKIWIVFGMIILVGAVAAGSFWAGMTYQSNQADQTRQRFMDERGIVQGEPPAGELPVGRQFPIGVGGFNGGGVMGAIKTIDGDTMTISTAEDVTTVHLAESTSVQVTETKGIEELQVGERVMVNGETDENGEIIARLVTVLDDSTPIGGGQFTAP